jgi:NAD(P)H-dependent FMN reductase
MFTIGVICGSYRNGSNGAGITAWVADRMEKLGNENIRCTVLDSTNAPLPLGPVTDPAIAAGIKKPSDYASPETQLWSQIISSLSALVIVTPQYNWGYPGELKNALDHLYHEWRDLPFAIFSYGGHGGSKSGKQLREVVEGALKAKVVSAGEVEITLPAEYIRGSKRVGSAPTDEAWEGFLSGYGEKVDVALSRLAEAATEAKRQWGL